MAGSPGRDRLTRSTALEQDARREVLAKTGCDGLKVLTALSAQHEREGRRGISDCRRRGLLSHGHGGDGGWSLRRRQSQVRHDESAVIGGYDRSHRDDRDRDRKVGPEGRQGAGRVGLVWCDVGATRLYAWRRR